RALAEARAMIKEKAPAMESMLRLYSPAGRAALFESHAVYPQLEKAFARRIRLASGADLVWDQTEALTVIDVNTGKYTGSTDLEETAFHTNMEAAEEIARLLRLRDAGGIVIIDFIDMTDALHRGRVLERLEQLLRKDRTKCHVVGWTKLGLLELTRKKMRENAAGRLYEPCAACRGSGRIYTGLPAAGR
ncbi:ribonuclease, partial [Paenibacillus darwinianus]